MNGDGVEILVGLADPQKRELLIQALQFAAPSRGLWFTFDGASALDLVFSGPRSLALQKSLRLVLLDLELPKMNGLFVLRCLKSHPKTREIPVILFSEAPHPSDETSSRAQGADGYFVMPGELDDLTCCITAQIQHWLPPKGPATPEIPLPKGLSILSGDSPPKQITQVG